MKLKIALYIFLFTLSIIGVIGFLYNILITNNISFVFWGIGSHLAMLGALICN